MLYRRSAGKNGVLSMPYLVGLQQQFCRGRDVLLFWVPTLLNHGRGDVGSQARTTMDTHRRFFILKV